MEKPVRQEDATLLPPSPSSPFKAAHANTLVEIIRQKAIKEVLLLEISARLRRNVAHGSCETNQA